MPNPKTCDQSPSIVAASPKRPRFACVAVKYWETRRPKMAESENSRVVKTAASIAGECEGRAGVGKPKRCWNRNPLVRLSTKSENRRTNNRSLIPFGFRISDFGLPSSFGFRPSGLLLHGLADPLLEFLNPFVERGR